MPKKIVLTTPHEQLGSVSEYTLKKMLVEYDDDKIVIELEGDGGQKFRVNVASIPSTTQEAAILALINNGVLAGQIV